MEHSQPERAARSRPLVLVVDDDPGLRESLRVILEDDYEVLDVPDGFQALEVVRSYQVDLVLLDIRMPGMDGITVLERMKALDEQIEVILVTAVMEVRSAVAAMKLGAFDYITKPFEEDGRPGVDPPCAREARAGARGRLPQVRAGAKAGLRRDRRPAPRDAEALPGDRAGRSHDLDRLDHRRERHRQGAGRARHPPPGAPQGQALRPDQSPDADRAARRIRTVRPRAGSVHRRLPAAPGEVRAGSGRHAVPGRGRRAQAGAPGEAPAGAPGAGDRAGRRKPENRDRRTSHRRDQPGLGEGRQPPRRSGETCTIGSR